jgi:hypothetical protein
VVCIHGIAQEGKSSAQLKVEWDAALRDGLRKAEVPWPAQMETVYPFYGKVLADKTADVDRGVAVGLIRRGGPPADEPKKYEFYDELLTEMAKARAVQTDNLTAEDGLPVARGVLNWPWVQAMARRLNQVSAIADLSIDTFTRDVWVYLNYKQVHLPIDRIVADALPSNERCVVVAHSLGTVISYNVLTALGQRDLVKAWITLGSPLGIEAIYRRLPNLVPKVARKSPWGVGSWYNARDVQDFVALRPIDKNAFAGAPVVEGSDHVVNATSNKHGIAGYLSDVQVARRIASAAAG